MFLLFHKNPIWSVEKEHRLFTYLHFDKDYLDVHGMSSNFYFEDYLCHSFGLNKKENAYVQIRYLGDILELNYHLYQNIFNVHRMPDGSEYHAEDFVQRFCGGVAAYSRN